MDKEVSCEPYEAKDLYFYSVTISENHNNWYFEHDKFTDGVMLNHPIDQIITLTPDMTKTDYAIIAVISHSEKEAFCKLIRYLRRRFVYFLTSKKRKF